MAKRAYNIRMMSNLAMGPLLVKLADIGEVTDCSYAPGTQPAPRVHTMTEKGRANKADANRRVMNEYNAKVRDALKPIMLANQWASPAQLADKMNETGVLTYKKGRWTAHSLQAHIDFVQSVLTSPA